MQILSDHETLSKVSTVGIHINFLSMIMLLGLQTFQCEVKLDGLNLFDQREILECFGHGPSVITLNMLFGGREGATFQRKSGSPSRLPQHVMAATSLLSLPICKSTLPARYVGKYVSRFQISCHATQSFTLLIIQYIMRIEDIICQAMDTTCELVGP